MTQIDFIEKRRYLLNLQKERATGTPKELSTSLMKRNLNYHHAQKWQGSILNLAIYKKRIY